MAKEKRIPVLTVFKNGAILKNIFVINQALPSIVSGDENPETFVVGRHPDCNIVLEHPSVSRFHLQIHSNPSLQKLSLVDLSSVHGTWVSGKKIEPGVRVELAEGDTIRVGGSSRVYRLQWLPLSRAYHLDHPFAPDSMAAEEIIENQGEILQDENPSSVELESRSPSIDMKASSFPDEEIAEQVLHRVVETCVELENQSPSPEMGNTSSNLLPAPVQELFLETVNQQCSEEHLKSLSSENEQVQNNEPQKDHGRKEVLGDVFVVAQAAEFENENQTPDSCHATDGSSEKESLESPCTRNKHSDKGNKAPSCSPAGERWTDREDFESPPIIDSQLKTSLSVLGSRRGKPASALQVQTAKDKTTDEEIGAEVQLMKLEDIENKPACPAYGHSDKGNHTPSSCRAGERTADREDLKSSPIHTQPKSTPPSIWSQKGKPPASVLQLQTARNSKGQNPVDTDGEDEIFTPDKENFTPNTRILRSLKRMGEFEEVIAKPYRSSPLKAAAGPDTHLEEDIFASHEKENQTILTIMGKLGAKTLASSNQESERMPFQSLLMHSTDKCKSSSRSINSLDCTKTSRVLNFNPSCNKSFGEERKSSCWNIIVDSSCLLNQESRKALQLLQGLKGTKLFIPNIVIRELDCLRRRGSLFRRTTTQVSSALQWIEACMAETKWWIHVQSSVEEGRALAPTPLATPRLSEEITGAFPNTGGTTTSTPFSPYGSFTEILSPTAEDRILDCALLFRRIKKDEQLVILCNDITLKIKAMAEGLICETAEKFRGSLVNPFSERFMWADSSPRGLTWSCSDDVTLREKYERSMLDKKPTKGPEVAKGLKLILLHNSQYMDRQR